MQPDFLFMWDYCADVNIRVVCARVIFRVGDIGDLRDGELNSRCVQVNKPDASRDASRCEVEW